MRLHQVKKKATGKKQSSLSPVAKTSLTKKMQVAKANSPTLSNVRPSLFIRSQLFIQLIISGTAAVLLVLLASLDPSTFSTLPGKAELAPVTAEIGLEYDKPVTVDMLFARKNSAGYLTVSNTSDASLHISLPQSWKRTEVRGAPIADFSSQTPTFGFRRWSMPPHSGMSLLLPSAPDALAFASPSASTAAITVRSVDIVTTKQFVNVVLLKNAVETLLWQE